MRKRSPRTAPLLERDGLTIREATILLDKSPCSAQVLAYNGDTLVIPNWTGQFDDLARPYVPTTYDSSGSEDIDSSWDVEDAADILRKLVTLKRGEAGEADEVAVLDKAISALLDFIRAEASEIAAPDDATGAVAEARAFAADPENATLTEAAAAVIREAGRRNSKKDQARIQAMHDYAHDAGATHEKGKTYAGMQEAAAVDVVEVRIEAKATPETVRFRESAAPGTSVPATLREASPLFDDATQTVWVTPIRPGWGNTKDNNYYPASTLREATLAGRFDHVKMFKDHPRKSDAKDLPERSVKDWFATTREATWDEARQEPRVPIKVHDDATWRHWHEAPEQVAFSVLGGGSARPGSVDGRNGRIIESIVKVGSVDWVTEAGAGGAIAFAESAADEEFDMDLNNLTAEQLKEANPTLYAALTGGKPKPAGDVETGDQKPTPTPPTPAPTPPTPAPVAESAPAWFTAVMGPITDRIVAIEKRDATKVAESAAAGAKEAAKPIVADVVKGSTLPAVAKTAVIARFAEAAVGEGQTFADEAALREAVTRELGFAEQMIKPLMGRNNVTGLGAVSDSGSDGAPGSIREAAVKSLEGRWGQDQIPGRGKYVFTAEELAAGQVTPVDAREAAQEGPARMSEGASASAISDASQGAQDRIAARLGI